MAKYRLRIGSHHGRDLQGKERDYKQGDVFESDLPLERFNCDGPLGPKFERLDDEGKTPVGFVFDPSVETLEAFNARVKGATATEAPPLESMTVAELRKLAEADSIDLGEAKSKEAILKVLKGAYGADDS